MTPAHKELPQELQSYAPTAPTAESLMKRIIAKRLHEKMTRYNRTGFYLRDPADAGYLIAGPYTRSFTPNGRIPLNTGFCGAAATSGSSHQPLASCNAATSKTMPVADHRLTPPLIRTAVTIPTIEANPTIIVIAISVGEKVPETNRAQPSRNIQIALINKNQKTKHGSAAHLLNPERRMPETIAIQRGEVCTMCRRTPCDTAPTTSNATIMDTQQVVKMRKRLSTRNLTLAVFRTTRCVRAPAVSGQRANKNSKSLAEFLVRPAASICVRSGGCASRGR